MEGIFKHLDIDSQKRFIKFLFVDSSSNESYAAIYYNDRGDIDEVYKFLSTKNDQKIVIKYRLGIKKESYKNTPITIESFVTQELMMTNKHDQDKLQSLALAWHDFAAQSLSWSTNLHKDGFIKDILLLMGQINLTIDQLNQVFNWAVKDNFWKDKIYSVKNLTNTSNNGLRKIDNLMIAFSRDYKAKKQQDEPNLTGEY